MPNVFDEIHSETQADPVHAQPQGGGDLPSQEHFDQAHKTFIDRARATFQQAIGGGSQQHQQPAAAGGNIFDQIHAENQPAPESKEPESGGEQFLHGAGDVINGLWKTATRADETKAAEDEFKAGNYGHAALKTLEATLPGYSIFVKPAIEQAVKAYQYGKAGRYSEAAGHAIAAVTPGGPQVADMTDTAVGEPTMPPGQQVQEPHPGEPMRVAGQVVTSAALGGAAKLAGKVPLVPKIEPKLAPDVASAVAFADQEGIPISAGTRTGDRFVKNVQALAQNQPIASNIASRAQAGTRAALARTSDQMATEVHPAPMSAEDAGTHVQTELGDLSKIQQQGATQAYGRLEKIEADPQHAQTLQMGTKTEATGVVGPDGQPIMRTAPITKTVALPVDMGTAIDQLKPVLARLKQEMPLAQQQASRGLQAIDNIVNGDRIQSASVADQNLSALKQLQREAVNPKTMFLANKAVNAVAPLVDQAVAKAGPQAVDALNEGRSLTKAKYATDATIDQLPVEPVRLFDKLTSRRDTSINLLRDVASKAPTSMPAVGRAYLEGLFENATSAEGKPGSGTAYANWNKLGDATKKTLFPSPTLRGRLDDFFTLAKTVGDNPNPSGTAHLSSSLIALTEGGVMLHNPVAGGAMLLAWPAVTKMLYSEGGAKLLMSGLRVPVTNKAVGGIIAGSILRAAGDSAKPMALPLAASDQQQPAETAAVQ